MKKAMFIMLTSAIMLVAACKKDDVIPSVEGTSWEVHIKWTSAGDTVLFYPRFDAGGTGTELDMDGNVIGPSFTWSQTNGTVTWSYASTTNLSGTISGDGESMTGTGTTPGQTAGWRAAKD